MNDSILVSVLGLISLVVGLLTASYRLYAHPLAGFPGPKFAAVTFLYEFYYDVVKGGMYIWEIERMHEKYGPIVRINPRELHVKDPSYYDVIHAGASRKRAKDPKYAVAFGAPNSLVGTINHDHHRLRRSYLSNYFSKRSITSLTPYIHQKVDQLINRFENAYHQSTVLHLQLDFAALTADVITHYCYGWSYGYLDDPRSAQSNDLVDAVAGLMTMFHINRFFPFLFTVFLAAPQGIVRWIQPQMASLFEVKARLRQQAEDTLKKKKDQDLDSYASDTIFDALVSPSVPPQEKTLDRLEDESALLLGAGTETTARAIAVSMFHLMNNKEMSLKLREELKTVLKNPQSKASWTDLEKLPYLTPVSQSNYFVHMDRELFPEPEKFDPDRWVRAAEKGEHLGRFIVAFTKGIRRFDFAPFETTAEDLAVYREQGVGLPKSGYFGVKAIVTNIMQD
ncbi:Trichodiene oxygenase [Penicillium subrubescens]|uniref:Trichodiene oxygenase n=1 Tax=Penicillium subrubescens TaxID=1316194 RepID=A0A1Q5UJG8_9EURO|nr:Trichodiene oxygenase [Penicillium subrubescens]